MPKPKKMKTSAAKEAVRLQTIQVGDLEVRVNNRVSLLIDQEAVLFDIRENPELVKAREGQPITEIHETMAQFYALLSSDLEKKGLHYLGPDGKRNPDGLTPYGVADLVPIESLNDAVERMNSLIANLPGADSEGN